jgi:hypothetical protein
MRTAARVRPHLPCRRTTSHVETSCHVILIHNAIILLVHHHLLLSMAKNLWNLPFNGISVAMGGINTEEIVSDVGLRTFIKNDLIIEVDFHSFWLLRLS